MKAGMSNLTACLILNKLRNLGKICSITREANTFTALYYTK